MSPSVLWYVAVGLVLLFMALTVTAVRRLPLSSAMVYLGIGVALGPLGLSWLDLDVIRDARLVQHASEVAMVISLFTTGLKLRRSLAKHDWKTPVFLAVGGMILTITLVAAVGVVLLHLPLGAAVLLGAVLAPTDPVLANEVQGEESAESLRFDLAGEAGLNDGMAFPFVILGLGLLQQRELPELALRWLGVELLWASAAGLLVGALLAVAVGRWVLRMRGATEEPTGLDDFVGLGLLALAYGVAVAIHASGFLAVFAAGLALPHVDGRSGPAHMARSVLAFNEHIERIAEVAIVVLLGALLAHVRLSWMSAVVAALLFLVIRPLAVAPFLWAGASDRREKILTAWFGIRGIGSIFCLTYAIGGGVSPEVAVQLANIVVPVVAASIIVHGASVTPLMAWNARIRYSFSLKSRVRRWSH